MPSILRPLTLEDVKQVLGRALVDPDFMAKLTADPKEVLSILGFEASQQGIDFFKNLKGSDFEGAGKNIDGALSKNGPSGWY
jgi:hypothetical protein